MLRYIKVVSASIFVAVLVVLMRISLLFPFLKKRIMKSFSDLAMLEEEELTGCVFHLEMLSETTRQIKVDTFKEAREGKKAPRSKIFPVLRDITEVHDAVKNSTVSDLVDLMEPGVPLVLAFGSCSCPPFYKQVVDFGNLATEYSGVAKFVVIYIEEAHPTDGWKFKNKLIQIAKHRELKDRIAAARRLHGLLPRDVAIYTDLMTDEANNSYGGFPERLYVLKDGKIEFQGGMGPFFYNLDPVRCWLEKFRNKQ